MTFIRQACTLSLKNWRILLRHPTATVLRALVVPLAVTIFLGFAKYLFVPPAVYGIGSPHPTRSLGDALALTASSGRNTVAFVNNGFTGGEIERVIDALVPLVTGAGKSAPVLQSAADLRTVCPGNLRGVTPCAGAVVFNASPREGTGGIWNYTLRVDGALGISINVDKDSNDGDLYLLPLQCAVDSAIVNLHAQANQTASLPSTRQYAFTSFTQEERAAHIRERYQQSLIDFLAVGFVAGMLGIVYHQVGFMAHEREVGLSQLIEAMLPAQRWPRQAQAARLVAYQLSFCLVYLPGWVAMGLFVSRTVFARSSALLLLLLYVLTGVALSSLSLLGAALFRKAKFSGITVTITVLLLAILAQSISWPTTVTCVILSVLFTPCTFVYFLTFVARFEHQGWRADLAIAPPVALWNVKGITFFILLVIQAVVYSLLAMHVEQRLHGTESKTRTATLGADGEHAVQLRGFTKIYHAGRWLARLRTPGSDVVAVHDLTLDARRGQILVLLGANGSGKSTTLDAVAGVKKISAGSIALDGTGGLGFAPQKNVLWDDLSVFEHIKVFNRLKSTGSPATDDELRHLIGRVDLAGKMKARASTLSGGQKRKLQLGMMLTGGSSVCCVDEVSSKSCLPVSTWAVSPLALTMHCSRWS